MEDFMRDTYAVIMDESKNPLQGLPKAQRFQIMTFLSVMWSSLFCLAIGSYAFWGELVVGHVAVAAGVVLTGLTFRQVNKQSQRNG
jgi:hypothetical protein